jgi:tetratricopeptide (TPR) repeat protein
MSQSTRLTVAVIVRDAAEALRETLASIQEIADEIVLVDTGSADETIDVARSFNASVFAWEWRDDFSAARNFCQSQAKGQWILWLDAGEQLSCQDAQQLRKQLDDAPEASCAYLALVEVPPNGPSAAAEQVARIRLVPNHSEIKFVGRVRESILESLTAAQIGIEALPVRICRGPAEHDAQAEAEKARRNIRLADAQIRETSPQAHLLNCLGDAFQTLDDNERAVQFFRHALQASQRGSADMLEAYYGVITSLDTDGSHREEQLAICVQALEIFPLDAQLLCAMGGYLQAQGQTELALRAYQTAHQYGQVNPAVWHVGEVHEIATVCYSLALQVLNRNDEALQLLQDALAKNQSGVRLRRHLIELHIKLTQRDDALQQVDQLPRKFPHRDALRSAVRGACLAAANNWLAAKAYLNTAYNAGCRDPICLRWFATTLLASGEVEAAKPIVMEWARLEPANAAARQYLATIDRVESEPDGPPRQVRIDEPSTQQGHLGTSPLHSPSHRAGQDTRMPHQR